MRFAVSNSQGIHAPHASPRAHPSHQLRSSAIPPRQIQQFNTDWRFLQSDATGAESPTFDDSTWKPVTLPHDWTIAGPVERRRPQPRRRRLLPHRHRLVPPHPHLRKTRPHQAHLHRLRRHHGQLRRLLQRRTPRPPPLRLRQLQLRPHPTPPRRQKHHRRPRRRLAATRLPLVPRRRHQPPGPPHHHQRHPHRSLGHLRHHTQRLSSSDATVHVRTTVTNDSDASRRSHACHRPSTPPATATAQPIPRPHRQSHRPAQHRRPRRRSLHVANPDLWDLDHPALYTVARHVCSATTSPSTTKPSPSASASSTSTPTRASSSTASTTRSTA